jgi:DNA-directed RNA polymerases I, II, and III subunit RPABC3
MFNQTTTQPKMSEAILYQDNFLVNEVDPGKYDRVARVSGTSGDGQTSIAVDVNTELYPLSVGDSVQIFLASTLNADGTKDDEMERGWREKPAKGTLAEDFDYVCHGKIYRFDELQEGATM